MRRNRSKKANLRKHVLPVWRTRKVVLVVSLLMASIVGTSLFAHVTSRTNGNAASGQVSIESLTASKPSRELIFAGSRMVASEEGYSISPTYQSFAGNGSGTNQSISVSAPSGISWTATKNQSWITIVSGSGTGNGTVTFSVSLNTDSMIRSGTITVNDLTFTIYQGINFVDVPTGHVFYDWIGRIAARGVTVGCPQPNFCPDGPVTQEQMAAFVIRALGMFSPPDPPSQRFNDVPPSNQYYKFIEQMGVRGIWTGGLPNGCPAGNYCPSNPVRRDEMAAIVIRGRGEFNPPTPATQRYGDVPPSNAYYNFVERMGALGITSGCNPNGPPPLNYCPGDSITRGQMAVFLVRAFNL